MEEEIGHITHWWSHIGVAGVHVDHGILHVGDRIHIKGHTTDLYQVVDSLEVEHRKVAEAGEGADVGLMVGQHVREHDAVYVVLEEGARHP